jgi:nucleoside-diphosphate-sugar epimerase
VLVTGAGGFSGTELVRHLLTQGQMVTAVVRSGQGHLNELPTCDNKLRIVQADLSVVNDLPAPVDAIFHVAARSPWAGVSVDSIVRDNVLATRNLIGYAKKAQAKLFVFFSSFSVYGEIKAKVLNEKTAICNPNPYGLTKLICEEMLRSESPSMRSLAIRLPGIIGPKSKRNWLSRAFSAACSGEDIRIFNANAPFNNAVHVADLCDFGSRLLCQNWTKGFDIVTLGAAGQLTVEAVAKLLAEGGGGGSRVIIENSNKTSYRISSAYAQARYGYSPMNIETMLPKFISENSPH